MIERYLNTGRNNTITGKELAKILKCDIRTVTEIIERERRSGGLPICAITHGEKPGYYLAESQEDIKAYTDSLKGRAIELFKTRKALLKTAESLPERSKEA